MGHVVRAIGAELHEHLLFRLRTVSTDEQLKDQIVIFFRLQLRLQVSFTGEILSSSSSSSTNNNEPQASPSVPKTPEPLSAKRKRVADDEDALHERLLKDPRGYGVDYLESLFDAVLKEMGRHNTTYHLSSTKRMTQRGNEEDPLHIEPSMRSFLDLAADVFLHLSQYQGSLSLDTGSMLSPRAASPTPLYHSSSSSSLPSSQRKRIKMTNVFEALCQALSNEESDTMSGVKTETQTISW